MNGGCYWNWIEPNYWAKINAQNYIIEWTNKTSKIDLTIMYHGESVIIRRRTYLKENFQALPQVHRIWANNQPFLQHWNHLTISHNHSPIPKHITLTLPLSQTVLDPHSTLQNLITRSTNHRNKSPKRIIVHSEKG